MPGQVMRVRGWLWVLGLLGLLGVSSALYGQTASTGTVVGTVTDASGAVVPRATVSLSEEGTAAVRKTETNDLGQYIFTNVVPGRYTVTVTAPGFRQAVVSDVQVEVAKSTRVNVVVQLGELAETVEVTAGAQAALQTVDATVGDVVDTTSLVNLPTVTRRTVELVFLQVGAHPWTGWAGNGDSGTVAGARPDQNTFLLDGLDISDTQVGGTCCGNIGMGIPIPVESIAEFRANITNQNASFNRSPGGQFTLTSRRGTNNFHGALYWYHRNDNLNANSWARNRLKQPNPELKDNRYGFRVGGPFLPDKLFFFVNMEGRRFPQKTDVAGAVPSDTLRQGILRFRDLQGNVVSYNVASFDPRGIGMSPAIATQFSLIPAGNDTTGGDGLNTILLRGPTASDQNNDNILARLDYQLHPNWRTSFTWTWAQNRFLSPNLNPGIDWRGGPNAIKTVASIPNDPYHYNLGVIGQITPSLNSETRVGLTQTTIEFNMPDPEPLFPQAGVALNLIGVEEPIQIASARKQLGISRTWQVAQNMNWVKGSHVFQFGGQYQHLWFYHSRVGAVPLHVNPIADIGGTVFTTIQPSSRPPTCAQGVIETNCLRPGDVARWNQFYAMLLGLVDTVGLFAVRDPNGNDLPGTPPLVNDGTWHNIQLYFNDIWRMSNSLTLTFGVNGMIEVPYKDSQGRRHFLIRLDTGQPLSVNDYLRERELAARLGRGVNPGLAFAPVDFFDRREFPLHRSLSPVVSAAWNPAFENGWFRTLFGNRSTVFRGGYRLSHHRPMAVGFVQFPQIGNSAIGTPHTLNAPACNFSGSGGAGCTPGSTDPALSQFRVGVDGPAPFPPVPQQIPIPFVPAIPFSNPTRLHWDPDYKYGYVHSANFTIQRELPWDLVLELGYIGRFGRRLEISKNINAVPFFIADLSGLSPQTFAQAFDAVARQLRAGVPPASVTPQPWFENSLGPGATVALASSNLTNFINGFVVNLWLNAIDPMLVAMRGEAAAINNRQIRQTISHTYGGWNNYNAFFVSTEKRFSQGLTFTFNYTLSKNLDTLGAIADSSGGMSMNPYDLSYAYGPSLSDRTHGVNAHWVYELPFGRGRYFDAQGWLDRFVGGWQVSGIFTYFTGRPLFVTQGGQPFGSFAAQESAPAIRDPQANPGRYLGVRGSGGVGTAGDPANGGTGMNLFANPQYVYESFRFFEISRDRRSSRGLIRGLSRWTFDMSFSKRTSITERISTRLSFDFFNIFNHPLFNDPQLDLLNPATFGVITSQPGDPGNGDFWAPRQIQFGFRIEF